MSLALLTRRELRRRLGRAILTTLGVAIGVAAIVAVRTTVGATQRAYRDLFQTVTGRASLEVVGVGETGFDQAWADRIAAVGGVAAAAPVVQLPAGLRFPDWTEPVLALGIDPRRDAAVRDLTVVRGHDLTEADGLLVTESVADENGVGPDDGALLLTSRGARAVTITGILAARGAATSAVSPVVVMRLETAQRLFALEGRLTAVQVVLADDRERKAVRERIEAILPAGLHVQSPADRGALSEESLHSTEAGLESLSGISLVAGAFVILNAFFMNLGERRKQIALLRALGARRGQVLRLFLLEAARLGVVGTGLGIALGLGIAWGLMRVMEVLMLVDLPALEVRAGPIALAAVVGPGVALAATWIPARRAARIDPLDGLVDRRARESERPPRWPALVGVAIVAATWALVPLVLYTSFRPSGIVTWAMMALLIGCVLALPLLDRPLTALAARLVPRVLGLEGRLAVLQLQRRPGRSAFTAGVIFIAVVVGIGSGNSLLASVKDIRDWYERAIPADFFVRGTFPDTGTMTAATIDEAAGDELAAMDGVRRVLPVSFTPARAQGRPIIVIARPFGEPFPLNLDLEEGDPDTLRRGLLRGEVVLATRLARVLDVGPGDEIELETRDGPRRLRVAGTVTEYTAGGSALYMSREAAVDALGITGVHVFAVDTEPGVSEDAVAKLRRWCREKGLLLQSRANLTASIDEMMAGVLGFIWLLIALMFVIAALGVVNTLTMNVVEQTREIGLMRAVALTRRQVGRVVLGQALAMAVMAVLPGVVVGIVVSWMQTLSAYPLIGHPVGFTLAPSIVLGSAVGAVAVAVLAARAPARRAARLPIIEALHYE